MQKFCNSDSPNLLLALILDDLLSFCFFLSSNPLHLVYLFLFCHHIVHFLLFFSPLLFSTVLLLLLLLTVSPCLDLPEFLGSTFCAVLGILEVELEDCTAMGPLEEIEYLVFAPGNDACVHSSGFASRRVEVESPIVVSVKDVMEDEFLDSLSENCDDEGNSNAFISENYLSGTASRDLDLTNESGVLNKPKGTTLPGDSARQALAKSMLMRRKKNEVGVADEWMRNDKELSFPEFLRRNGSMHKEKEWCRTLACKLYEERVNFKLGEDQKESEDSEQMDLLWEAYEVTGTNFNKCATKVKNERKKREVEQMMEESEEEHDGTKGRMCCLHALRFSTGKMNLGVGGTNLAKISKVLKGMKILGIGTHSSRKK